MAINRNKIKQWSITFPQSGVVSREDFAKSFPPMERCLCSQEEHEDGNPHLHLGLILKKPLSKSNLLKWISKKWPNDYKRIDVQGTRSIECWNDYISKEDVDKYEYCDESFHSKRKEKIDKIIEDLTKSQNTLSLQQWREINSPARNGPYELERLWASPTYLKSLNDLKAREEYEKYVNKLK